MIVTMRMRVRRRSLLLSEEVARKLNYGVMELSLLPDGCVELRKRSNGWGRAPPHCTYATKFSLNASVFIL